MKKVYLAFAAVLAVSALIVGCNKDISTNENVQSETEFCNPFDFVGEMHNAGLDAVLSALPETKSTAVSTEEIERLTDDFCEKVFSNDERFFVSPTTKSGEYESSEQEEIKISEEASEYLDKIIAVASTNNYDYIKEQYASFEEDILLSDSNIFSDYEETLLLCTIAVGKYSNEYWKEFTQVQTKGLVAAIVAGDAIGAVHGIYAHALEIVVCGAIGGPGALLAAAGKSALGPAIVRSVEGAIIYGASHM